MARMRRRTAAIFVLAAFGAAAPAHASLFSGDTLDLVANILAWIVLFVAPAIAIAVFWIVHILPEKIAEKRHHPQAPAIKTLCLLSLFFGGLLWPLAWLWAYSRPVLYKMAYGVDRVDPHAGAGHAAQPQPAEPAAEPAAPEVVVVEEEEPASVVTPARATRTSVRERRPWET
jgi:hypothetical protein